MSKFRMLTWRDEDGNRFFICDKKQKIDDPNADAEAVRQSVPGLMACANALRWTPDGVAEYTEDGGVADGEGVMVTHPSGLFTAYMIEGPIFDAAKRQAEEKDVRVFSQDQSPLTTAEMDAGLENPEHRLEGEQPLAA